MLLDLDDWCKNTSVNCHLGDSVVTVSSHVGPVSGPDE